jgi:hypothetical protein
MWDIIRNTESDEPLDRITETLVRVLNSLKSHIEKDMRRGIKSLKETEIKDFS